MQGREQKIQVLNKTTDTRKQSIKQKTIHQLTNKNSTMITAWCLPLQSDHCLVQDTLSNQVYHLAVGKLA